MICQCCMTCLMSEASLSACTSLADRLDVPSLTLVAGGVQRPHGVFQLRKGTCPTTFKTNPAGGFKPLVPVTNSGSATLRFPRPGTVSCHAQQT